MYLFQFSKIIIEIYKDLSIILKDKINLLFTYFMATVMIISSYILYFSFVCWNPDKSRLIPELPITLEEAKDSNNLPTLSNLTQLPGEQNRQFNSIAIDVVNAKDYENNPNLFFNKIQKEYINYSKPVIIKNIGVLIDGQSSILKYYSYESKKTTTNYKNDILVNKMFWFGKGLQKNLRNLLHKLTRSRVYYTSRFSGGYKACHAHIDGDFMAYNFYYVVKGRKRCWIVPRQYNDMIELQSGYHSSFVKDDYADLSCMNSWLSKIPCVYEAELSANDVLLFNNCASVHKFINLEDDTVIYTTRVFNYNVSKWSCFPAMSFNWNVYKFAAEQVLYGGGMRNTTQIAKPEKDENIKILKK